MNLLGMKIENIFKRGLNFSWW